MNLAPAGTGAALSANAALALGEPVDSVARFHLRNGARLELRNGARLERINWLSDTSVAGMRRAAGMMVNYLYHRNNPRCPYDAATRMDNVNASRLAERLAGKAATRFSPSAPIGVR